MIKVIIKYIKLVLQFFFKRFFSVKKRNKFIGMSDQRLIFKFGYLIELKYIIVAAVIKNIIFNNFFIFIFNFFFRNLSYLILIFYVFYKNYYSRVSFKNKCFCLFGFYFGLNGLIIKKKKFSRMSFFILLIVGFEFVIQVL